jgi:hypothetical protein
VPPLTVHEPTWLKNPSLSRAVDFLFLSTTLRQAVEILQGKCDASDAKINFKNRQFHWFSCSRICYGENNRDHITEPVGVGALRPPFIITSNPIQGSQRLLPEITQ